MIVEFSDIVIGLMYIFGIILAVKNTEGLDGLMINFLGYIILGLTFVFMANNRYFCYKAVDTKGYLIRETSYGYLIEDGKKFIQIEDHHSVEFIEKNPNNFTIYENRELFGSNIYIASY